MSDAIRLESVSKVFRRGWRREQFVALDNVSLAVEEGEVFGFIGPNGAGKSTAIKLLTGLLKSSSGVVSLFGKPADDPKGRLGLGYVPENPSLPDYLSPLEILQMALHLHGVKLADEMGHCMRWLDRFELAHVAKRVVRDFSKGMLQRTALAQALVIKPRLLILDEPLSGLDPVGRKDVVDILAEYRNQSGTLFLTSHVLHDVERLADRFGLIHKGKLRSVQSPAMLVDCDDRVLVRSMGISVVLGMIQESPNRWVAEILRTDLWALLDGIKQAGHELVEVKHSLSLESVFLRVVQE